MASTHKHIRSSTANKRPTTAIADGQIALNTNSASPGLFFKDSTGATIIKIGPVHVGATAPNASPAAGGSAGNSTGEIWLDNSLTPVGVKIWNGSAWVNATPIGSTTVQGLLELATDAETQAGSDNARAVTPASLQSKVSDSTSTTSSTTIASSTAVKAAYDLADAALPKTGGTITGNLEIGTTGSLSFEGSTADGFETTIAVVDPTADRTITLPNTTGTVVTTGDTGTVTSTMIANDTIVNADINSAAAIAGTKISPDFGSQTITTSGLFSHALGTAGAPTITFTGDTNTGIYSPGADQVAISTNGSGRLFVDASGNVGVGLSSPAATFGKAGSLDANGILVTRGAISAHQTNAGVFQYNGNETTIRSYGATAGTGALVFNTGGGGGSADSERLRITSAGLVGVGTSAPNNKLTLQDGTVLVRSEVTTGASNSNHIGFSATSTGGIAATISSYRENANEASALTFNTWNGSAFGERMRVSASGSVGIGTTAPTNALQVVSGSNYVASFNTSTIPSSSSAISIGGYLNSGAGGSGAAIRVYHSHGATTASSMAFEVNGATEAARIDSSGRLLVGTSSSVASDGKLQVKDGGIVIYHASSANGAGYDLRFATDGGATARVHGQIQLEQTAGNGGTLKFSTTADGGSSPTERMRIDNRGRVNVGGTGMAGAFTVDWPANLLEPVVINDTSNTAGQTHRISFRTGGTETGKIISGTTLGTSYVTSSDYRLKQGIVDLEDAGGRLAQLKPRRFSFINSPETVIDGFVAHEVQDIVPEAITGEKDAVDDDGNPIYQGIDHSRLVPLLTAALQEAIGEIKSLKARVAALEAA